MRGRLELVRGRPAEALAILEAGDRVTRQPHLAMPSMRSFLVQSATGPDGELLGAVAVLGITSLPPDQAGPADLLAYLRGHWAIEMHHYVRDVVFGEDASRIHCAHRAKAAVRNTIAGILHLHQPGPWQATPARLPRPDNAG